MAVWLMGMEWFGVPDSAWAVEFKMAVPRPDGCGNGLWRKDGWLAGKGWDGGVIGYPGREPGQDGVGVSSGLLPVGVG